MSACVSQDTIAAIISKACKNFEWSNRTYTWQTMLRYIHDIALEEYQLTLADLETNSRRLAMEITRTQYEVAVKDYKWTDEPNLQINYQSIPYIFGVSRDGIITVIFNDRHRVSTCEIKEITTEMMELIKYMGLVRMYILEDTNFIIPLLPDNIIHLEIYDQSVVAAIDKDITVAFPRFLRGYIDHPAHITRYVQFTKLTYTNRLPDTLIKLDTTCTEYANLPPNLVYYKLVRIDDNSFLDLPNFELFPIGIESIIILNKYDEYDSRDSGVLSREVLQPPANVKYLEMPIGHILTDTVVFSNIETLCISVFYNWVSKCILRPDDYTGNLKFNVESPCICGFICDAFEHTTKIILEDGIENLILSFSYSLAFLKLIEYASASLTLITIKTPNWIFRVLKTNKILKGIEINNLPIIPLSDWQCPGDFEKYNNLLSFHQTYPHIAIVFNYE